MDIAVQNGSVSSDTSTSIVEDIRSRKIAIVNGQGTVHCSVIDLDKTYGLSDSYWR